MRPGGLIFSVNNLNLFFTMKSLLPSALAALMIFFFTACTKTVQQPATMQLNRAAAPYSPVDTAEIWLFSSARFDAPDSLEVTINGRPAGQFWERGTLPGTGGDEVTPVYFRVADSLSESAGEVYIQYTPEKITFLGDTTVTEGRWALYNTAGFYDIYESGSGRYLEARLKSSAPYDPQTEAQKDQYYIHITGQFVKWHE